MSDMTLAEAARLLHMRDIRGRGFHYTSCGIYYQGIITMAKPEDDPSRVCTCGMEEAERTIASSPSIRLAVSKWTP